LSDARPTKKTRLTVGTRLKRAAGILLAVVLVLALLEGLASFGLFAFDLAVEGAGPVPERTHTRHDPDLGWANVPGARAADLYGPGLGVTINAQGFRNAADFPVAVPPGKVRVVCSGDSFTFGFGVADGESWPARLAALDDRLETVNMGQAGYGIDQSYLWYLRDGRGVEHRLHVLAAVVDDVWRMRGDNFLGYGKPMLKLDGGRLVSRAGARRGFCPNVVFRPWPGSWWSMTTRASARWCGTSWRRRVTRSSSPRTRSSRATSCSAARPT